MIPVLLPPSLSLAADNGVKISCCKYGVRIRDSEIHPECYPIQIPPNDPFYAPFGERCMELVRSVYAPRPSCYMGPREQVRGRPGAGSGIWGIEEAEITNGLFQICLGHVHIVSPCDVSRGTWGHTLFLPNRGSDAHAGTGDVLAI